MTLALLLPAWQWMMTFLSLAMSFILRESSARGISSPPMFAMSYSVWLLTSISWKLAPSSMSFFSSCTVISFIFFYYYIYVYLWQK